MSALSLAGQTLVRSYDAAKLLPLSAGEGEAFAIWAGVELRIATYWPAAGSPRLLLIVFHGTTRNARRYRDHARPLADQLRAAVVSPEFPRSKFPRANYQFGGVGRYGSGMPHDPRVVDVVRDLVDWCRTCTGLSAVPVVLLGHSAGAQLLSRCCAYAMPSVSRVVIANPSTWVLPTISLDAPYGLAMPRRAAALAALRRYLRCPILVVLGGADTGQRQLARSKKARAQGPNRLERGLRTFAAAKRAAHRLRCPLGWRLLKVPQVGHSPGELFATAQLAALLDAVE